MSPAKKQRTHPTFDLLYHPVIPGRGEYVRLFLEAAGLSYHDVANASKEGYNAVLAACDPKALESEPGNPPAFAPPALKVPGGGPDGGNLLIWQTPNILAYLAEETGLLKGSGEQDKWHVSGLTLTALDLSNEAHDTHHPIAVGLYYEDQKDEALRRAKDFRENRIPKFFSYFERVLKGNEKNGKGKYLVGDSLTYADLTVWQVLDGLKFAYPKELEARKQDFPLLFDTFYPAIKEEKGIKEYLASDRRKPYGMGLFRHYPELDRQ